MEELEQKLDSLAISIAKGFERMATKDDLANLREEMATKDDLANGLASLRQEIKSDVDVLLDQHLQTYMKRYDELAKRVKNIEEVEPQIS